MCNLIIILLYIFYNELWKKILGKKISTKKSPEKKFPH